jgi:hypothetical protein
MLLQPKGNTDARERFHVPSGIGKALILTGVVEEYVAPPKPMQAVRWTVNGGGPVRAPGTGPTIHVSCPNCGKSQTQHSDRGTAHETAQFIHCGTIREKLPEDIADQYKDLWKLYAARSGKKKDKFYSALGQ